MEAPPRPRNATWRRGLRPGVDVVGIVRCRPDAEIAQGGSRSSMPPAAPPTIGRRPAASRRRRIPDSIANPSSTTTYAVTTTINRCAFTDTVVVEVVRLM